MRNATQIKQVIVFICALMYVLPGIALVLTPTWFYSAIADFPPFNRHYMGDAGVFSVALGVGLLMAMRRPAQNRAVIGTAAVGNALHVINHLYDDIIVDGGNLTHLLSNSLPLGIVAILLIGVWVVTIPNRKS